MSSHGEGIIIGYLLKMVNTNFIHTDTIYNNKHYLLIHLRHDLIKVYNYYTGYNSLIT